MKKSITGIVFMVLIVSVLLLPIGVMAEAPQAVLDTSIRVTNDNAESKFDTLKTATK